MKRFQKMVIGALTAGLLLAGVQPVSAEPSRSVLGQTRTTTRTSLKPFIQVNRLQREKGVGGRIQQSRSLGLMRREKGGGGQLARDRARRKNSPPLISKAGFATPMRQQAFFRGQRPKGVMFVNRAERRVGLGQRRNVVNRLKLRYRVQRSVAFRPSNSVRKPVLQTIDSVSFTRQTLSKYVAANSIGSVLIQKDPVSGKTFRLQFAGAPVTKRISSTQAAIRCNFFGTDSPGGATVPVVMELGMTGAGPNWRISDVRFVSVNGQQRPGTFAFSDEEFDGQAAVAAEDTEEKEFPTKSL
ncbi:MAG: hypothetical protein AMXMBFR33_62920 [Candidatus Xenobia bacterium]